MPKRNASGGGTIRQRKDGRWEARYTCGRDPGTGRQVQRSIYGKTQAEVRKKLRKVITSIDEGIYTAPCDLKLCQWLDIWLNEYTANLKPFTLKSYKAIAENHLKPAIGAIKLSAIMPPTIQSFYNSLARRGLSPKTIKNIHGMLHRALEQALQIGYLQVNASAPCKLPRTEKKEIKPFDDEQIKAFLQAIKGNFYERLFVVDVFTGLRQGEIIGLSWDCIDFETGRIRVYRQLQRRKEGYIFESLKNNKARTISVAPFVMRILKEQKRYQSQCKLIGGEVWNNPDNLVFTKNSGEHLSHVTVYNTFKRITKSIGLNEARFHDLRHTYAVLSLQAGDDIKTVQENLGHHTAAFTLDVYGHITEKMKKESANRMDKYIKGLKIL